MNAIDRKFQKKIEKLENLDEIEARLARQEKMTHMVLIAVVVLTVVVFAMPLGHILYQVSLISIGEPSRADRWT